MGNLFHIAHTSRVYVSFRGHDLWPTLLPSSLSQNSLDSNNLVSGAYLRNPWRYYIHNTHTHHLRSIDVPIAGHDF